MTADALGAEAMEERFAAFISYPRERTQEADVLRKVLAGRVFLDGENAELALATDDAAIEKALDASGLTKAPSGVETADNENYIARQRRGFRLMAFGWGRRLAGATAKTMTSASRTM